jgi:cytochrome c553
MRKILYGLAVASLGLALVVTFPHAAWSYASFQRLPHVSDAEPFCAGCHASVDASYQSELPAEASQAQVYTTKHYKALEEGSFPGYKPLEPDQRKQLLEQAKKMDQNSSVKVEASAPTVAPGGTVTVTVTTKGGIGPVVGIMLLGSWWTLDCK